MWQSGFLLGGIAGPAIGGPLTDISLRAPFFVYAATLAVAGSIGMLFLTHTPLHDKEVAAHEHLQRTTLRQALRVSGYRAALVTNLGSGWALFGVRSSLIPLFVTEALGKTATWTGIGFFVSAATQGAFLLPAGRIADTVGRRPAMITGSALATVSMGLLASFGSLGVYVFAMALFGCASAFLSVAPSAAVGDVVTGRGGTVVAAFQMSSDLGAVVGPLVAGWLADQYSFGAAFAATTGVVAAGLLASIASRETRHRAEPDAEPESTAAQTPST
jgi:MFS family permease